MKMNLKEFYTKIGGDYENVCTRLISEKTVCKFLQKFPDDPCMGLLLDAVKDGDIETSFRAIHTLKGVTRNLGFTRLYDAAVDLTEQLRPRLETADLKLLDAVKKEYDYIISMLNEFFGVK